MQSKLIRRIAQTVAIASVVLAITAVAAMASTYSWLNGDSVAGGLAAPSAACRNATTSYGHRLDGPAGAEMEIEAWHANSNCNFLSSYCTNTVYGDEAYCNPPGTISIKGILDNWNSYADHFNAHLTY